MSAAQSAPSVTICLLTYGDYKRLVQRALNSFRKNCSKPNYTQVLGANNVSPETQRLLEERLESGEIDRLHLSPTNIGKSPMMRRMFSEFDTEFIWWFDDDAYVSETTALDKWLEFAG